MIRRLQIKNFKSLRNVDFEPGLNNLFVGANASGKTNLLDALWFLRAITQKGLKSAVAARGGFEEMRWKGEGANSSVEFDIDFDLTQPYTLEFLGKHGLDSGALRYQFSIGTNESGALEVLSERLESEGRLLAHATQGAGTGFSLSGAELFQAPTRQSLVVLESRVPGWPGTLLRDAIWGWRFYDLVPQMMTGNGHRDGAEILLEQGQNLSEFLLNMKSAHPAEFKQLEQAVRDCFPALTEIIPQSSPSGSIVLASQERGLRAPVQAIANGQLVFTALMALICAPATSGCPLICIEEPENHLHPKLVQQLVEMFLAQQENLAESEPSYSAQLFATTHSPYVIDRAPLDSLWLVSKSANGETNIRQPIADESLKESLANVGLGELWFSGALAGE